MSTMKRVKPYLLNLCHQIMGPELVINPDLSCRSFSTCTSQELTTVTVHEHHSSWLHDITGTHIDITRHDYMI